MLVAVWFAVLVLVRVRLVLVTLTLAVGGGQVCDGSSVLFGRKSSMSEQNENLEIEIRRLASLIKTWKASVVKQIQCALQLSSE